MIKIKNISKTFDNGKSFVVDNLSLEVQDGEILVLLGSSGSGKTTTLKLINRLIQPTSGVIEIDGQDIFAQDIIKLRRSIGYVFQHVGLFPHMTVSENISILLRLEKWSQRKQQARVRELMELVDLSYATFAQRYPDELSGGQQQRVGIIRALAIDPKYMLMDEPFAALDTITRQELQDELLRLKQKLQKTIVFVTHDINEALKLGDRIAVLHQGKLEQIGSRQQLLEQPATQFVRELFAAHRQQVQEFINREM